jgi:hypothetical protein
MEDARPLAARHAGHGARPSVERRLADLAHGVDLIRTCRIAFAAAIRSCRDVRVSRRSPLTSQHCWILVNMHDRDRTALAVLWLLFVVVSVQLVGLLLVGSAKPDLRASECDFPEECLADVAARFDVLRWLWIVGVVLGGVGLLRLAASSPRAVSLARPGLALAGLVLAGAITPVLREVDAIEYDEYAQVTVLTDTYLAALVVLTLSAMLLTWELGAQSRRERQVQDVLVS